ncbi:MAG: hypothetical protein CME70_02265 [Halobacteriovorax sp.]|nr:hypothetical protein [Halobacteriovorax sp.]|tara:strand:+ start:69038 stop:70357 length:1320 start_codon:yes stop_codon:yes gene_type:complete
MTKLTTILFTLLLSFAVTANDSVLEAVTELAKDAKRLDKQIAEYSRPLRMGSRREKRTIVMDWKKEAREKARTLRGEVFRLKKDLEVSLSDTNSKLDPALLQAHLNKVNSAFEALLTELKADKYKFKAIRYADRTLKSYRKLEETLAEHQIAFEKDNTLDGIVEVREKTVQFKSANQVCHTVSSPGEIILRKALMYDGSTDSDFGPATMKYINFLEKLKGNDQVLNYRHAEVISNLESYNNIETESYYPWIFNLNKPEEEKMPMFLKINNQYKKYQNYRTKYTVLRVKGLTHWGETKKRELALARLAIKQSYSRLGTCADFANWTYFHAITSNWNVVPVVKQAISMAWLPEGMQTPDNLADSHMTQKICEVENSKLIFPKRIEVKSFVNRLKKDTKSNSKRISEHAEGVMKMLKEKGVIDENGERLTDIINIKIRSWSF